MRKLVALFVIGGLLALGCGSPTTPTKATTPPKTTPSPTKPAEKPPEPEKPAEKPPEKPKEKGD